MRPGQGHMARGATWTDNLTNKTLRACACVCVCRAVAKCFTNQNKMSQGYLLYAQAVDCKPSVTVIKLEELCVRCVDLTTLHTNQGMRYEMTLRLEWRELEELSLTVPLTEASELKHPQVMSEESFLSSVQSQSSNAFLIPNTGPPGCCTETERKRHTATTESVRIEVSPFCEKKKVLANLM